MDNTKLKKIVEFLHNNSSVQQINKEFLLAELEAKNDIDAVKLAADKFGVNVSINEVNEIQTRIERISGISGIRVDYKPEFTAPTARITRLSELRYAVQQSITDYFVYHNGELSADGRMLTVTKELFLYAGETVKIKREFKNGKIVYFVTSQLFERLELIAKINEFFNL